MTTPLMPKATALWLIENTMLTFEQISEFCNLHQIEVQAIADAETGMSLVPFDPVANQQLTQGEIDRCTQDNTARLKILIPKEPLPKRKGKKYTPVSKRAERPDAIAWFLKFHPELDDAHVMKLLGTTKPTIDAVRNKTHWNSPNIKPRCPVTLGLCSQIDLDEAVNDASQSHTFESES